MMTGAADAGHLADCAAPVGLPGAHLQLAGHSVAASFGEQALPHREPHVAASDQQRDGASQHAAVLLKQQAHGAHAGEQPRL